MGRGGRRTQRRHFRENRENVWKRSKTDANENENENGNGWEAFTCHNPGFEEYYKAQNIVCFENEWDSFMGFLRTPLPAAFRVNSGSQFYRDIITQLQNEFSSDDLRPLPWYPHNLAWHSNFSRMQLRKNQSLHKFHHFLKLENEIGNITRQEAVSMIPPLFLSLCPNHYVLDMCAAPGSKTFQLLEFLHQPSHPRSLPTGLVVANDVDVQRCNLLIHQTKRMSTSNLIVTNHEAQHFPACRLKTPTQTQLSFDRVLCDVPCSGDGTLRKAPDIWRKWNSGMGNGVHTLQLQIAMRGLHLLKVGGRMVYSTCSMNPVENEAVVAEILRRCGGSVQLVDVSTELPQLVRRPGLKKWKVRDKGAWLASYKSALKYRRNLIVPSMFPSGRADLDATETNAHATESEENHKNVDEGEDVMPSTTPVDELIEEVSEFPLERCMRIVPHDQNTGAFFIAVLHKHSPLPACQENPNSQKEKLNPTDVIENSPGQVIENDALENSPGQVIENDALENSPGQVIENEALESTAGLASENSNGLEGSFLGGTDNKHSESASDVDLIDEEGNDVDLGAQDKDTNNNKNNKGDGGKRKLQRQGKWKGVDPVLFFKDEAIINSIKTFYGIDDSFPLSGHLVSRNPDNNHIKRIYYISKSVRDTLDLNFRVGQQLKIASIGLKMFERQTSREGNSAPCAFRISSEGLPVILPHVTKQIVHSSLVDFKHLLQYKSVKYTDFVDADFGTKAVALSQGCCVVVLRKDGDTASEVDASTIAIGCWKGRSSLTVMVTAVDCQELLERLAARFQIGNTNKESMETDLIEPLS